MIVWGHSGCCCCYSCSRLPHQVLYFLSHSQECCDGGPVAVVANVGIWQLFGSSVELRRRTGLGFQQVYLFLPLQIEEERITNPHLQRNLFGTPCCLRWVVSHHQSYKFKVILTDISFKYYFRKVENDVL